MSIKVIEQPPEGWRPTPNINMGMRNGQFCISARLWVAPTGETEWVREPTRDVPFYADS